MTFISEKLEATFCHLCETVLDNLAHHGIVGPNPEMEAENFKFAAEVIVCFQSVQNEYAERIVLKAYELLFTEEARRTLACDPAFTHFFLTVYVNLPPSLISNSWTNLFRDLLDEFPPLEGNIARFRLDEIDYAKRKLSNRSCPSIELDEYVRNAPWLSREHIYSFTHSVFYITDYGTHLIDQQVYGLAAFVEDKCIAAYLENDLDVLLELIICYKTLHDARADYVSMFKTLAYKIAKSSTEMMSVIEDGDLANFRKYYHQALLFLMLNSMNAGADLEGAVCSNLPRQFRNLCQRNRFMKSMGRLDFVQTYRNFVRLRGRNESGCNRMLLDKYTKALKITGVIGELKSNARKLTGR